MNPEIAVQLRLRGIDAVAARGADMLETSDHAQLRFAVENGRVICTEDSDFTKPEFYEREHHGIAYFPNSDVSISYAVKALLELLQNETAESMKNSLRYL